MKLLLEGSLDDTLVLKELLAGIFQAKASGLSLLKLTVPGKDASEDTPKSENGDIYFLGGHFIVSATANDNAISGIAALEHIMQFEQAKFVYYACESLESLPPGEPLKVDLKQMIDDWNERKPISQNKLLDKIFDVGSITQKTSAEKQEKKAPVSLAEELFGQMSGHKIEHNDGAEDSGNKVKSMDWDTLKPLLIGGAPAGKQLQPGWSADGTWAGGNRDLFTNPPSPQEIRALSTDVDWQRKLRRAALILIIFLVICILIFSCAWFYINSPSANFSPKRFSIPFQEGHERHGRNKSGKHFFPNLPIWH